MMNKLKKPPFKSKFILKKQPFTKVLQNYINKLKKQLTKSKFIYKSFIKFQVKLHNCIYIPINNK